MRKIIIGISPAQLDSLETNPRAEYRSPNPCPSYGKLLACHIIKLGNIADIGEWDMNVRAGQEIWGWFSSKLGGTKKPKTRLRLRGEHLQELRKKNAVRAKSQCPVCRNTIPIEIIRQG